MGIIERGELLFNDTVDELLRRAGERFAAMLLLIADDPGGDFDDAPLDGNAELLDEHDFLVRRDGEDANARIRVRTANEIPVADAMQREPLAFKKSLQVGHGVKSTKKHWRGAV